MPLYEFKVIDENGNATGEVIEELFKHTDVPNIIRSSNGRFAVRKKFSIIAKPSATPESIYGVNGTFNRGLGQVVYSHKHYDQICQEKGLVPESQLSNKYAFEDLSEARLKFQENEDKELNRWEDTMKKEDVFSAREGTKEYTEKWERVWDTILPAHEALDKTAITIQ
jgi:hypothetical protein